VRTIHGPARVAVGLLTVCLFWLGAGCEQATPGRTDPEAGDSARDSAGAAVVTADGPGWTPAQAWFLEPDLRAGAADGPEAFGRVRDVTPRVGGGMWILDPGGDPSVIGVDSEGRRIVEFGRDGEGPDELRRPVSVMQVPDGRLAVGVAFPPALHWFGPRGTFLGTTSLAPTGLPTGDGPVVATWDLSGETPVVDLAAFPKPGVEGIRHALMALHRVAPGQEQADVGAVRELARWTVAMPDPVGDGEVEVLAPQLRWAVAPDGGVWTADGATYELRLLSPDAALRRIVRRQQRATPVDEELGRRILARLREGLEDGPSSKAVLERTLERVRLPDRLPFVGRLWASTPDGTVWAEVIGHGSFDPRPALRFDVFSPGGRYLGCVTAPAGFTPHRFTRDAVYGVWEDDLGVTFAARYRIVRPGE